MLLVAKVALFVWLVSLSFLCSKEIRGKEGSERNFQDDRRRRRVLFVLVFSWS